MAGKRSSLPDLMREEAQAMVETGYDLPGFVEVVSKTAAEIENARPESEVHRLHAIYNKIWGAIDETEDDWPADHWVRCALIEADHTAAASVLWEVLVVLVSELDHPIAHTIKRYRNRVWLNEEDDIPLVVLETIVRSHT